MNTQPTQRIWELDAARGMAVVSMVGYHLCFMLWFLGITGDWFVYPGVKLVGRVIAGTFLIIVGFSLQLWYERRIAVDTRGDVFSELIKKSVPILGSAGVVTLVTLVFIPTSPVWFGILHVIGFGNVLSYVWLKKRLHIWPSIVVLFVIGWMLRQMWWPFIWLLPLGFRPTNFSSLDYAPLFPQFGYILIGIWLARERKPILAKFRFTTSLNQYYAMKLLVPIGQNALLVYMLHVPMLLLLVWMVAKSSGLELALP